MSESNGYQSPFIDDGMEGEFTIPAIEGMWSAVTVRYRPFCMADESEVLAKLARDPDKGSGYFYAELCASKIRGWNLKNTSGEKVDPTAENIRRLNAEFYQILRDNMRIPVQQIKN